MKAHVGRVLAALTVDELWEVRDRVDGFVENATHPERIVSGEEEGEEETVDDRSGWILEQRADPPDPLPPEPLRRRRLRGKLSVILPRVDAMPKVQFRP